MSHAEAAQEPGGGDGPYAPPRLVTDLRDCIFYHTMEIPGYGLVEGAWDLRRDVDAYLGGVDFRGKRVLELGTASGFLCCQMERRGAEVVASDLSEKQGWDVVPFARDDFAGRVEERQAHIRRLNNGWWLNHRANNLRARVVYSSVYDLPEGIGPVDITVAGCILLHLRDPFRALERALRLTRERVVIVDRCPRLHFPLNFIFRRPLLEFQPRFRTGEPKMNWWVLTPEAVREFIGVLGFEKTALTHHVELLNGRRRRLFTIVGRRTAGGPAAGPATASSP